MFGRNLKNVKAYCDEIGADYSVNDIDGFELVYVYDKDARKKRNEHPRKYKNLYVSYIRISDHGGDGLYTRHDGICGEMTDKEIKEIIDELTFGN